MRLFISCLLVSILFSCTQEEQAVVNVEEMASAPEWGETVDSLFRSFNEGPGYAVGVVLNEELVFSKGYGMANLDYAIPISDTSIFSIASVSKQFTAACLAVLIQKGKLDLETPAARYVPALEKYYPDTIRVKHLVYNCSGIDDYHHFDRTCERSWITFQYFDNETCIQTALEPDTLLFAPGTKWNYCNINFMLLAKVIEEVSGVSLAQFARERIFDQLGMESTFIHDDPTMIVPNRVMPYNTRDDESVGVYRSNGIAIRTEGAYIQHHRNSPHYGGSGVMSTVKDLAKWCANFETANFGGESFIDLMQATPEFIHGRNNQAFGLYIGDFNGKKTIAWDGGDWGISSQILRFPDQGVAIICLSNIGTGQAWQKANQIAQILEDAGVL